MHLRQLILSMPVYLLLCTVDSLLAGGSAVLSAQYIGNGNINNIKKSEMYYKESILMCVITGGVIAAMGAAFCHPLSRLLCQGGELYD